MPRCLSKGLILWNEPFPQPVVSEGPKGVTPITPDRGEGFRRRKSQSALDRFVPAPDLFVLSQDLTKPFDRVTGLDVAAGLSPDVEVTVRHGVPWKFPSNMMAHLVNITAILPNVTVLAASWPLHWK
jgi:hypothetical protein